MPSPFFQTPAWRTAKRIAIAVAGTAVLAVGVCMVVLPGPALLVLPAGLAILAAEFSWARRLLDRTRQWGAEAGARLRRRRREDTTRAGSD